MVETPKINGILIHVALIACYMWLIPVGYIFANASTAYKTADGIGNASITFYIVATSTHFWTMHAYMDGRLEFINFICQEP